MSTPRAIVIGASIGGLATALRLHEAGWNVLVIERTPSRRSGGYAVAFAGVGYDAAERMGILLVGADGLHSIARRLVFGPEYDVRLDLNHMAGVFTLDTLPDGVEPGVTASLTDTGRTLAVVSLGANRAVAFFGYRTQSPMTELADGPQVALPRAYSDMGWVAPNVLEQLTRAESVYFGTISQTVLDRWSRGRVVLMGDAAWCVTLFAGYGSSLAVAGADALGAALERNPDDLPAALREWEAAIRPEAERKQKLGRQVKGLYAPADPFRIWLRDLPLRLASFRPVSALLQRRL